MTSDDETHKPALEGAAPPRPDEKGLEYIRRVQEELKGKPCFKCGRPFDATDLTVILEGKRYHARTCYSLEGDREIMKSGSELDKMRAVKDDSAVISGFIDWLEEEGYQICKHQETIFHSQELGDYTPEGWYPQRKTYEQLLADFFEIDLEKIEQERRELLESLQG